MKIFAKDTKLEALFRAGDEPKAKTLLGRDGEPAEWKVTILTGFLTIVYAVIGHWLRHRKLVTPGATPSDRVCGSNVFFKGYRWGWFDLTWFVYTGGDNKPLLCVDYRWPKNSFATRRICDYLRTTKDPNKLIGRFYYKWRGKYRFLGYFTLTRIQPVVVA